MFFTTKQDWKFPNSWANILGWAAFNAAWLKFLSKNFAFFYFFVSFRFKLKQLPEKKLVRHFSSELQFLTFDQISRQIWTVLFFVVKFSLSLSLSLSLALSLCESVLWASSQFFFPEIPRRRFFAKCQKQDLFSFLFANDVNNSFISINRKNLYQKK